MVRYSGFWIYHGIDRDERNASGVTRPKTHHEISDSSTWSLRHCLEKCDPRTCRVFGAEDLVFPFVIDVALPPLRFNYLTFDSEESHMLSSMSGAYGYYQGRVFRCIWVLSGLPFNLQLR